MPFSESGMQPDVIINPHAFPSRMTIGMLVESMAGKAGSLHGLREDGTPWTFNETDTPHDYFGEQLVRAGYSRLGHEPMYSGITGQELQMDIYLGVVYYQRLRHMVNDKFQCRTTGPVHALTRQPIKGRKVGGGIRFGEMERDATLAHGCAFLLADRLMNCSDYSTCYVCRDCGSITSLGYEARSSARGGEGGADDAHMLDAWNLEEEEDRMEREGLSGEYCRVCRAEEEEKRARALDEENGEVDDDEAKDSMVAARLQVPAEAVVKRGSSGLDTIAISYVTRYLAAELASMGVKLSFKVA